MKKIKKLVLVECEMKKPKGHFLNNLIDTTISFENKFDIYWILNKKFNKNKTYIPKVKSIIKCVSTNKFKRNENKFLYSIEEIFYLLKNIILIFYYFNVFLKEKKISHYYRALKSNYFILPRYFGSFYPSYQKLKFNRSDHIFFTTARRKDIALVNFLTKIDSNHPNFHIRVMLPPKIKFKGFFYYLREINNVLKKNRAFIYLWSDFNFKLFIKNSNNKSNIFKSNIPWTFYNRKYKKNNHTIGFIGDARRSRGFHLLPKLIKMLEAKNKSFNYLIHFSKISDDLIETKKELYTLAKYNNKIKIVEKYSDYNEFLGYLKKIDIMPILHSAAEINAVTSGTLYSCVPYEIPIVVPFGTEFMKNIQKFKSYEKAKNVTEFANKIYNISKKYQFYLNNMKLNSKILQKILKKDPLQINIS